MGPDFQKKVAWIRRHLFTLLDILHQIDILEVGRNSRVWYSWCRSFLSIYLGALLQIAMGSFFGSLGLLLESLLFCLKGGYSPWTIFRDVIWLWLMLARCSWEPKNEWIIFFSIGRWLMQYGILSLGFFIAVGSFLILFRLSLRHRDISIGPTKRRIMWRLSFFAAIWKERNRRCFEGKSLAIEDIIDSSCHTVAWVSILPEFWGLNSDILVQIWKEVALFWLWLQWLFILFWVCNSLPLCWAVVSVFYVFWVVACNVTNFVP